MRQLIPVLLALTIFSCQKDTNSFSLTGTAKGYEDGTLIYVYTLENSQPVIMDTLTIVGEEFKATYPKSDLITLNYLQLGAKNQALIYFPENEDLKATIYKDSIDASFVSGSKQNEAYTAFVSSIRKFNKKKQDNMALFQQAKNEQDYQLITNIQQENRAIVEQEKAFKKQFAFENNNSIYAVMLVSEMLSRKEIGVVEATEFVAKLSPKMSALSIADDLKVLIASSKKADVGTQAPEFSAPSPNGDVISLNDALGKYTIIDFWASWCRPCRIENPNVVNVYNKYHDKGLNIISVSLDREGQHDRWVKAIQDDKMDWYHVSNLKFWNDPIAKMYNVSAIPATFLLDENGVIIDKNLRGPALEAKIASLLGQ